ncbi:MAG: right-handed parallel beta-helix repeat-containing protein [Candidatus Latescibacteria bacterium]|nr:right-handed parallel beta-helix repeat-containing protein [Candidatus Latescibacterota bacterium]
MRFIAHSFIPVLTPSLAAALLATLLLSGCSGNDPVTPPPPSGFPAPVADLHAESATTESITLSWTAPALASGTSPVSSYDLRYIPYGQENSDFATWTAAPSLPTPSTPGQPQQATITALTPGAPYAFRLRATVDGLTWSAPSNLVIASADPALDLTPPADVVDLALQWSGGDLLMVQWSPTGDDGPYGAATTYELRSAPTPLTPETWDAATPATSSPTTTDNRLHCLIDAPAAAGPLYVALRAVDDAGNRSGLSNIVSASPAGGRTWRVNVDGSGDVPTIGAAIAAAVPGDLILVGPGRYTHANQGGGMSPLGMVFFARDVAGITLASRDGPQATILDAEHLGRVLFIQAYNEGVVVDGFTITNGVSPAADGDYPMAGGLTFHLVNCTIRNCIFTGNSGGQGGAIYYGGLGHPVIEDCLITGNTSTLFGGGVYLVNCEGPVVRRCTITGNTTAGGGGGLAAVSVILQLEDCLIANNHADARGGGLAVYGYSNFEDPPVPTVVTNCTIAANDAPLGSGVRLGAITDDDGFVRTGRLTMENCLIAWNTGGDAFDMVQDGRLDVSCCDLYGAGSHGTWPAGTAIHGGNFQQDPLFCDLAGGDFHLEAGSPCAEDAAACGRIGALPVGCGR